MNFKVLMPEVGILFLIHEIEIANLNVEQVVLMPEVGILFLILYRRFKIPIQKIRS